MPSYTVEAFQWSGTGYNAQYNSSVTATFTDNDGSYQGSGDSDEQVQIDGGSFNATGGSPYKISVSFTDTSGDSHVEDFQFFYTSDGGWHFVPGPDSEFSVGATLGSYQSHTVGWDYSEVVCFVAGTKITTPDGQILVEDLQAGDLVECHDGIARPITRVLCQSFSAMQLAHQEKLRPVKITAGALGGGLPERDLLVSRQHRFLAASALVERVSGNSNSLISAIKLCALPGIFLETTPREISYYHLEFETHQIIFAEGALAESLLLEKTSHARPNDDQHEEASLIFPNAQPLERPVADGCNLLTSVQQKSVVAKLREKGKSIAG